MGYRMIDVTVKVFQRGLVRWLFHWIFQWSWLVGRVKRWSDLGGERGRQHMSRVLDLVWEGVVLTFLFLLCLLF